MLTQKIFTLAQSGSEVILWFLIALSIISVTLIIERFLVIRKLFYYSDQVIRSIRDAIQSANLQEIEEISRLKDSLEGRALGYGLRYVKEHGPNGLEEIFNSYALMEKPILERNLNFLATLGSNAPFVGLLGTVLGIMKAFHDLGGSSQGDAKVVMVGIAEALVATAVGLFVAIPAVVAYNHFQKQVKNLLQNLELVKEVCLAYCKQNKGI